MALALFDLDETLIAGDSASLWLEYMVTQELAPADMIAEEQAMMSLYHQGKMDMHQYMAFTLQPLAGKTRQWLDSLCHHFAEQVLREFTDAASLIAAVNTPGQFQDLLIRRLPAAQRKKIKTDDVAQANSINAGGPAASNSGLQPDLGGLKLW